MAESEINAFLSHLAGDKKIMATLMYGAGLRLMEWLQLRVQDIDFSRNEILMRPPSGAGNYAKEKFYETFIFLH